MEPRQSRGEVEVVAVCLEMETHGTGVFHTENIYHRIKGLEVTHKVL